MGFWDWASQGDNLICLAIVVVVGVVAMIAAAKGKIDL